MTIYLPNLAGLHVPTPLAAPDGAQAAWWNALGDNLSHLVGYSNDWTPTWKATTADPAIGNGTLDGSWEDRGGTWWAKMRLKPGSTTTAGTGVYYFTLPAGYEFASTQQDQIIGVAWFVGTDGASMFGGYVELDPANGPDAFKISVMAEAANDWFVPLSSTAAWDGTDPFIATDVDCEIRADIVAEVKTFDPATDIAFHTLLWGDGPHFRSADPTEGTAVIWANETGEADFTPAATTGTGPKFVKAIPGLNYKGGFAFDSANVESFSSGAFETSFASDVSLLWVVQPTGLRAANTNPQRRFLGAGITDTDSKMWINAPTPTIVMRSSSSETGGGTVTDNDAHHIVMRYVASGNERIYLDGASTFDGAIGTVADFADFRIGREAAGLGWHGYMALFAMYDGDLTADASWARFKAWVDGYYGTVSS